MAEIALRLDTSLSFGHLQVGPLANPTEIYQYYSLPFCAPQSLKREKHDVGQYLAGDRRVNTPYDVRFKVSEEWRELCNVDLSNDDVQRLIEAIDEVRAETVLRLAAGAR